MNQNMKHKLASRAVNAKLQKVVRRRQFKAFLITSTAIYALGFLFWSMSVEGFVSQSQIRLSVADQASFPAETFTDHVARQWEQQLSDNQLDQQIESLAETIELKDPVMLGKNYDRVRKSLDYRIVRSADNLHYDVYLTYQGYGSEAELGLINRLSDSIATRFATISLGDENDASHWVEQQLKLQDSQQESLDRIQWLVSQLDADITEVRSVTEELAQVDKGAIAWLPVANSENNWDGQQTWPEAPPRNSAEPNRGSTSEFQNVSHRSEQSSVARIKDAIDSIDVISLKSTVAQLDQTFESQRRLVSAQRLASGVGSNGFVSPVRVVDVTRARAKPLGGLPSSSTALGFLLLSMLAGSVVVWNYSPLTEDRGFVDSQEIERKLMLPVISTLIRKSGNGAEGDLPLGNLVTELGRLALLVVLLIIIFGLVFDPSARATFADNPVNGMARIIWNLLGK